MQNRQRPLLALIAATLVAAPLTPALSGAGQSGQSHPGQSQTGATRPGAGGVTVSVTVTDLRNTRGRIIACMTSDEEHFPRCREASGSHKANAAAAEGVVLRFTGVAPGTYAIALLHDENENGRADRALSMIPREGFGFSRDAPVRMGPPSFEDAAFTVGTGAISQTIRMRYML